MTTGEGSRRGLQVILCRLASICNKWQMVTVKGFFWRIRYRVRWGPPRCFAVLGGRLAHFRQLARRFYPRCTFVLWWVVDSRCKRRLREGKACLRSDRTVSEECLKRSFLEREGYRASVQAPAQCASRRSTGAKVVEGGKVGMRRHNPFCQL